MILYSSCCTASTTAIVQHKQYKYPLADASVGGNFQFASHTAELHMISSCIWTICDHT